MEPTELPASVPTVGITQGPNGAITALQRTMAKAGWEIDFVDLDLAGDRPTAAIRCHRYDGRWISLKVDALGRCSFERWQRSSWLGKPANVKGRWPLSPQIDDLFLGRISPPGPRAMLRQMTLYLAENALHPISVAEIKSAWAGVMGGRVKLSAPAAEPLNCEASATASRRPKIG